jgi:hypothetical protein
MPTHGYAPHTSNVVVSKWLTITVVPSSTNRHRQGGCVWALCTAEAHFVVAVQHHHRQTSMAMVAKVCALAALVANLVSCCDGQTLPCAVETSVTISSGNYR